jgi:hypothetical protein
MRLHASVSTHLFAVRRRMGKEDRALLLFLPRLVRICYTKLTMSNTEMARAQLTKIAYDFRAYDPSMPPKFPPSSESGKVT